MIIDYENHLVFLANRKVGSTSLEAALRKQKGTGILTGRPILKHTTFANYLKMREGLQTETFQTVAVIRHPTSKAISWYRYRARDELKGKPQYTGDMSFVEFLNTHARPLMDQILDSSFVVDESSGRMVDKLFKYEDYDKFRAFLTSLYGPGFELRNLNVSPEVQEEFAEGEKLCAELFADEIAWYENLDV